MDFQKEIREAREQMVEDIKKLVSINSVEADPLPGMPFGEGPAKALKCTLELGEKMGFQTENFDNYAGHIDFGEGDDMLGILCHVDVVPCGEGWICDPYDPQVIDGKLYGRGVLDDKGPMVACLHAMRILKEKGVPLKKKVRLIAGANEETNWACMDYYFNRKKVAPPQVAFTPDADFPLKYAEKGVLQYQLVTQLKEEIKIGGGNAFNSVPERAWVILPEEAEKAVGERITGWEKMTDCRYTVEQTEEGLRLDAYGRAAHAAWPAGGINAITGIMAAVHSLGRNDELGRIASFYMDKIGQNLHGEKIGAALEDEHSGKLTFNVGMVEAEDGRLVFSVDNRVPVTHTCMEAVDGVKKELVGSGFTLENPGITESIYIDKDSFLVQTLIQVYKDVTGDLEAEPQVDGGCTYARTMKNCVAFGALLKDQPNVMHEKNEFLEVEKLDTWLEIYLEAIYRLAK